MNWLVIGWALTLGYCPAQGTAITDAYGAQYGIARENALTQTIDLSAKVLDFACVWTTVKIYDTYNANGMFAPYRADFRIGAYVHYGPLELGVSHECDHNITWSSAQTDPLLTQGDTTLYVKVQGETKF